MESHLCIFCDCLSLAPGLEVLVWRCNVGLCKAVARAVLGRPLLYEWPTNPISNPTSTDTQPRSLGDVNRAAMKAHTALVLLASFPRSAVASGSVLCVIFQITADHSPRDHGHSLPASPRACLLLHIPPTFDFPPPLSMFYSLGACEMDPTVVFTWLSQVTDKVYWSFRCSFCEMSNWYLFARFSITLLYWLWVFYICWIWILIQISSSSSWLVILFFFLNGFLVNRNSLF